MKMTSIVFTLTVFLGQMSHSQVNENIQLQNEMSAQGIHLTGLLNTTQNELIQALQAVGGEKVLEDTRTHSKIAYRARLVVTNSPYPKVKVEFKNGQRFLSQETGQDIFDAAILYYSQHSDASLRRKITSPMFDAAIKCIEVSGQGLDQIIWCGFFDGFIN